MRKLQTSKPVALEHTSNAVETAGRGQSVASMAALAKAMGTTTASARRLVALALAHKAAQGGPNSCTISKFGERWRRRMGLPEYATTFGLCNGNQLWLAWQ